MYSLLQEYTSDYHKYTSQIEKLSAEITSREEEIALIAAETQKSQNESKQTNALKELVNTKLVELSVENQQIEEKNDSLIKSVNELNSNDLISAHKGLDNLDKVYRNSLYLRERHGRPAAGGRYSGGDARGTKIR